MSTKAVSSSGLEHTSASQIVTGTRCLARWGWDKLDGLRPPETGSQGLGTKLHKQNEDYYEQGVIPEHPSARALMANPRLPKREHVANLMIEYPRDYKLGIQAAGVNVKGRIDLVYSVPDSGRVELWDWKSTKNFRYCKSPEELARNTQLIIYGYWAFEKLPGTDSVILAHGYMKTEGTGAKVSTSDPLDRDHVYTLYERDVVPAVEILKVAATFSSGADLPRNPHACNDYNQQCPYFDRCWANKSRTAALLDEPNEGDYTMTLKERLMKASSTSSTPPPTPGGAANDNTEVVMGGAAQALIEAAEKDPTFAASLRDQSVPLEKVLARGINPPDATKPVKPPQYEPHTMNTNALDALSEPVAGRTEALNSLSTNIQPTENGESVILKPEGKKRGRPAKAKLTDAEKAELKTGLEKLAQPAAGRDEAIEAYRATHPRLTLYINAFPVKTPMGFQSTPLEEIIQEHVVSICEEYKVKDIRMPPLNYGNWKAVLAARINANPPTGVVIATSGELTDVAVETLLPLADVVIRGTR